MLYKEVIIVGGGPAGSSCAWQLARNGVECLILDAEKFPREKLCAGWITPEVFNLLELAPQDYPHALTKFRKFRISFPFARFRLPVNQFAIRRIEFDNWLLKRARVDVEQHRVVSIKRQDERYVIDDAYSCKYLVGAGGTNCPVYRTIFSESNPRDPHNLIVAMEEEFEFVDTYGDCHLWFFRKGLPGYAWYVPKAGGMVNVGLGGSALGLKKQGKSLKDHWAMFINDLQQGGIVKGHQYQPRGYSYYLWQPKLKVSSENAFIVGDAAGLATRDMGEGIRAAVHSGILAADAILHGKKYSVNTLRYFSFPSILLSSIKKSWP